MTLSLLSSLGNDAKKCFAGNTERAVSSIGPSMVLDSNSYRLSTFDSTPASLLARIFLNNMPICSKILWPVFLDHALVKTFKNACSLVLLAFITNGMYCACFSVHKLP